MAVVQISRIQIRRGRANGGTGFPQLASGELGWAIDTQELYIGNGAVSEGAPAVGNTKIITEYDFTSTGTLLNSLQHIYGSNNPNITVVTGHDSNSPVARKVQDCLDDHVSVLDFGASINGITDYSEEFQRAVNQLFLNPSSKSSVDTADGASTRVSLNLPAGKFNISSTIYIPSYASIIGAGSDKTIINFTGTGTAFQFVNDTSSIGNPSSITSTHWINQPRHITLIGLTINTATSDQTCLQLDAVRDSVFGDLKLVGNGDNLSFTYTTSRGISLNAISNIVTCENNIFRNITIRGFYYGVYSKQDIKKNLFDTLVISNMNKGVSFGENSNGSTIGEQFGPCDNTIINTYFTNVLQHGVYIGRGTGNFIDNCKFDNVGNEGGGHAYIQYPQLFIGQFGNTCNDIRSDRTLALSNSAYYIKTVTLTLNAPVTANKGAYVQQVYSGAYGYLTVDVTNATSITVQDISVQTFDNSNLTIDGDSTPSITNTTVHPTVVGSIQTLNYIPYVAEVGGHGTFRTFNAISTTLGAPLSYVSAIRLPAPTDENGVAQGAVSYKIQYQYKSIPNPFTRDGVLFVSADIDNASVKLSDEYDFIGYDPAGVNAVKLDFRVRFLDQTGAVYTGALNQIPSAIDIEYINTLSGDTGVLSYTYVSSF